MPSRRVKTAPLPDPATVDAAAVDPAAADLARVDRPRSLDRLRGALKFSLWTWALYWPGGGLLLLMGGLDLVGVLVTFGSLATFAGLMATGALRADSSRSVKEFLVERPLYLLAALVVLVVLAALVPSIEGFALLLFATTWLGGLVVATTRLVEHVRTEGKSIWSSRADQLLVVFALSGFFSALVFLDALLPLAGAGTLGSPAMLVAICTWMNLLYPVLVMVASRPFRDPLRWPSRREPAAPVAVAARRKAKVPTPFRAS